jgi:prophage regulatory protein
MNNPEIRLFRLPQLAQMTGLSASRIRALMALGQFPRPIKISQRASAVRSDDYEAWLAERTAASRTPEAQDKDRENPVKRGRPPKAAQGEG